MATLNSLLNKAGATPHITFDHGFDRMTDHMDVDLRGLKVKNVTIETTDDGTRKKVGLKRQALERQYDTTKSYAERAILQAQIDVLKEVLR
ncbi:hypothetical protein [Streptomyces narbonensis]|uniref:hypothetical protein n=1 Tax=Streptomyces narbonensis TaxID=67333 RepID=UPI0033F47A4B